MDERAVIGPLFTHAGFQSWFFVCLPKSIVALRMGFWFAITSNRAAGLFVGGAAGAAMTGSGDKTHANSVLRLMQLPEHQLTAQRGSIAYAISELSAVTFKRRTFSNPEVIVATRSGDRRVFGIMNHGDQAVILETLVAKYGPLVTKE